jgi:RNA polymerase sigma factor (sigma-70 family)
MESVERTDRIVAHREPLLRFIRSRGVDDADAEDILQDGLLKALRAAPDLEDDERLVPWLFQIVRNAMTDHFRRGARESEIRATDSEDEMSPGEEEHRMTCACLRPLLETLTPGYGEVIEAIDLEGESTASLAARLGITRGNLKVRLHRARAQLRERLEETCRTCAAHGCLDCACT